MFGKVTDHVGYMGLAERTHSKVADYPGKVGLAEWETKDKKLAVNYCEDCHNGRSSQSHMREFIGRWG